MLRISATGFRRHLYYYLKLCKTEDIEITKRGEVAAVLTSPERNYRAKLLEFCGCFEGSDIGDDWKEQMYKDKFGID